MSGEHGTHQESWHVAINGSCCMLCIIVDRAAVRAFKKRHFQPSGVGGVKVGSKQLVNFAAEESITHFLRLFFLQSNARTLLYKPRARLHGKGVVSVGESGISIARNLSTFFESLFRRPLQSTVIKVPFRKHISENTARFIFESRSFSS